MRSRAALLAAAAAVLVTGSGTASATPARTAVVVTSTARPAVVEVKVIGHSVRGRPIYAWRVGDPQAKVKAVAMAVMHGNEAAPAQILRAIRDGRPVHGIDLWLLPVANPDGLARGTRQNAHRVDLNRNFPYRWARLTGSYYSGTGPASERETRVLMHFFADVRPRYVVSFHQPLYGVDTSVTKARPFARRLADELDLPRKRLVCGGVCHGTFTEWFNHKFAGVAVTVEYGDHPSRYRMRVTAPRQLVRALGGTRS
ncbi:MAG: M14 family zinc carboxypeptidase [Nocardioidaceae bacterium]